MTGIETDICVIGGGSGGLTAAAGAAQMGAKVVLVEKGAMGGDCLNTGCVPSKALLAAAHGAETVRRAQDFGVVAAAPTTDMPKVRAHIREIIAAIAPHDSVERFEALGVRVIQAAAQFTGPRMLLAGDTPVRARYFIIATGSTSFVPPIPGLQNIPFLTNETIFDLDAQPEHLLVIGGGPIGMEMAQAHRRLGAKVSVVEMGRILAKDDAEAADVLRKRLTAEGVSLYENTAVVQVGPADSGGVTVQLQQNGRNRELTGSHLLVAAGRRPALQGLNLEKAGVTSRPDGIEVDARLRTANKRIFAIGDVTGGYQFTHTAAYEAGIVIRNILFRLPAKARRHAVPWVTYTDPEVAHVGLSEARAVETLGANRIRILRWPFAENDRAIAERQTDGFVKIITDLRGRVRGATIVGPRAGELIAPWCLMVGEGMKIGKMAGVTLPYPTLGEAGKRAAGSFYTPTLFSPRTRCLVSLLMKLSR